MDSRLTSLESVYRDRSTFPPSFYNNNYDPSTHGLIFTLWDNDSFFSSLPQRRCVYVTSNTVTKRLICSKSQEVSSIVHYSFCNSGVIDGTDLTRRGSDRTLRKGVFPEELLGSER